MRIVFMGSPSFAVPSLEILLHDYEIAGVVTATDKLGGRGKKKLIESAVKTFAIRNGLNVLQPRNLKSPVFLNELKALNADLQVVVAFRMLPVAVWDMPPMGTINLHGSLLPKYRGAAPINWAIINGEKETGVTTFKLKHEIDTGDIIFQDKLEISETDDAGSVHDNMMKLGAQVVLKTVKAIEKGNVKFKVQDDSNASKAPKIYPEMCRIDFSQMTDDVYNFIRGLSPYPGSWTIVNEEKMKIFSSKKQRVIHDLSPGTIVSDNKSYFKIATLDGFINALEVQLQGRKRMHIIPFLNGFQI